MTPPFALSEVLCPLHKVTALGLMLGKGFSNTTIVLLAEEVQLLLSVTVTTYVVVITGLKVATGLLPPA